MPKVKRPKVSGDPESHNMSTVRTKVRTPKVNIPKVNMRTMKTKKATPQEFGVEFFVVLFRFVFTYVEVAARGVAPDQAHHVGVSQLHA
eukprot:2014155-Rhodomonas_salina.2